jgi:dsRNA-specific ribonuclease
MRRLCVSLKGFDNVIMTQVDNMYVQEKFAEVKQMTRAAQSRLAFLGDRIIHLVVAHHLNDMYEYYDDRFHMSLHQASLYYVTGNALAQCFDGIELEKPASGNKEFSEHTKGDKVEQLAAYLH